MSFEKFLNDNKVDIDSLMDRYISKSTNIQVYTNLNKLRTQEFVMQEILKKYNNSNKINFQNELKDAVKPMFIENLSSRIDKRQKDDREKRKLQVEKRSVSLLQKQGVAVDKKMQDTLDKKIDEKQKESGVELTQEDLEKEAIKALYEEILEKYYTLRQQASAGKKGQIETGDLDLKEKTGTELVLYENYLKKINMQYMAKNKSFIAQDDKQIQEKENKYANRELKNQKVVNQKSENNLSRINELNDELESIALQMEYFTENSEIFSSDHFDKQMDVLQQEYIDKSFELRNLSPNMLEIKDQLESSEKLEEFRSKTVGENYQYTYNKKVMDISNVALDNQNDYMKDKLEKQGNKEIQENVDINIYRAEEILDEAEKIVEYDPDKASEMVQSARLIVGIGGASDEKEFDKNLENEDREEKQEKIDEKYGKYSVRAECTKGVKSKEEILKEDISRTKKEISQAREEIQGQKQSKDRIR